MPEMLISLMKSFNELFILAKVEDKRTIYYEILEVKEALISSILRGKRPGQRWTKTNSDGCDVCGEKQTIEHI